jgi:hypothetical protein
MFDALSGGLACGAVHELLGVQPAGGAVRARPWLAPVSLMIHLACCVQEGSEKSGAVGGQAGGLVLWIGRDCWPSPLALHAHPRTRALLCASVYVEAASADERAWALDVALRSGAACAVMGDASGLGFVLSRRLQLAAQGGPALCVLARPAWEEHHPSAASTRWLVSNAASDTPAWHVRMLRCKGSGAMLGETQRQTEVRHGIIESNEAAGRLVCKAPGRDDQHQDRRHDRHEDRRAGDGDLSPPARDPRPLQAG